MAEYEPTEGLKKLVRDEVDRLIAPIDGAEAPDQQAIEQANIAAIGQWLDAVLSLPSTWVGRAFEWNWLGTNDATSWRYMVTARGFYEAGNQTKSNYWMGRLRDHSEQEAKRFLRENPEVARQLMAQELGG